MLKQLEKIEDSKVKLEIEVAAPDVDTALARAYHKVVKKINLPGFRKGKVPRRILESRFGPEVLHEEALELLVPPAYDQAVREADINPVDQPDFELIQIEEGKPLLFNAVVEIIPPVELGQYRGLQVEQEEAAVDDIQVDHHLYMLREQNARLEPREDGPAEEGDLITIDFKGYIGGEPFEGGEAENYSLELGSKSFIPGFEEQLIGAKPEEERDVALAFPENYQKEELAGRDAVFKVKVKQIKQKKLPDLDDEFVKEVSEFETLEDMKTDLKEKLLKNAEDQSKNKLEESLIEKIASISSVTLPEKLVERQIDRIIGDLEGYLRYQGMAMDQFLKLSGKSMEELRGERREEAENRTRANLVLDAIAKKEGFDVDDSELESRITTIAESYNDEPERIREIFEKQGRIPIIREEIRVRKVIDLMVAEADIKKVKKKEAVTADEEKKQAEKEAAGSKDKSSVESEKADIAKEETKG